MHATTSKAIIVSEPKWVRSNDGWFLGVFEGLAKTFGLSPNFLRVVWIVSFFGFGVGLLFYLVLGLTLPRENQLYTYNRPKVLGSCYKIAKKTGFDLGMVRAVCAFIFIASFGASLIAYLLVYLFMDEN